MHFAVPVVYFAVVSEGSKFVFDFVPIVVALPVVAMVGEIGLASFVVVVAANFAWVGFATLVVLAAASFGLIGLANLAVVASFSCVGVVFVAFVVAGLLVFQPFVQVPYFVV